MEKRTIFWHTDTQYDFMMPDDLQSMGVEIVESSLIHEMVPCG